MERLYTCACPVCAKSEGEDGDIHLSEEELEAILRQIYERDFDVETDIQRELYRQTLRLLNEAVDRVFTLSIEENREFVEELKHNNAVFAAFKTHREQNDLAALLTDEAGKPRSFNAFRKATEPVIGEYNVNWLQTEYLAAIRSARTAERFRRYLQNKDLYPNLRWLPSRAVEPREVHRQYYYQVRSLDDPWWLTHYPGCLWRCQCDMENTKDAITHVGDNPATPDGTPTKDDAEAISPGLDRNPAFTGSLFTPTHPYVAEAYPGARKAVERFMEGEGQYTVIPTDKGVLRIHSGHGKGERAENIRIGSYLANKYGYEIDLLPRDDEKPCADAYNWTLGYEEEYKVNLPENPTKSSIDNLIRSAKRQADHIVLWIDSNISYGDLTDSIKDRIRRCRNIKTVVLVRQSKDHTYTREDILRDDFKIQQADLK